MVVFSILTDKNSMASFSKYAILEPALLQYIVIFILFLAAYEDLSSRTASNWFSVIIFIMTGLLVLSEGYIQSAVIVFFCTSLICISLFFCGVWGGADAKLFMALLPSIYFAHIPLWIFLFSVILLFQAAALVIFILIRNFKVKSIRKYEFPLVTTIFLTHSVFVTLFGPV